MARGIAARRRLPAGDQDRLTPRFRRSPSKRQDIGRSGTGNARTMASQSSRAVKSPREIRRGLPGDETTCKRATSKRRCDGLRSLRSTCRTAIRSPAEVRLQAGVVRAVDIARANADATPAATSSLRATTTSSRPTPTSTTPGLGVSTQYFNRKPRRVRASARARLGRRDAPSPSERAHLHVLGQRRRVPP